MKKFEPDISISHFIKKYIPIDALLKTLDLSCPFLSFASLLSAAIKTLKTFVGYREH